MARNIFDKLGNVLKNDRTTTATYRETLSSCESELAAQTELERKYRADSTDPTLNISERDDAHSAADRAARNARTLADGMERLSELITAREASETAKAAESERAEALAERDALVPRWNEIPAFCALLTDLFAATTANAERLRRAGIYEPDAEAMARGIPGNFANGAKIFDQFTKMKIPAWSEAGRAWPPLPGTSHLSIDYVAMRNAAQNGERRKAEEFEASFGLYRVANKRGFPIIFETRHSPGILVDDNPWEGEVSHDVVAKLRKKYSSTVEIEALPA